MIGRAQLSDVEESTQIKTTAGSESLADEMEIRRIVDEIDNSVDAKNWQTCRSYFLDTIEVDFTSLGGGEQSRISADDLIKNWQTTLFAEKKSHHMRSNHRINISGETAEVFSKGYAFNFLESGDVTGLWEVWGDYQHRLERTSNGWKVSAMTFKVTHSRGDEKVRLFVP